MVPAQRHSLLARAVAVGAFWLATCAPAICLPAGNDSQGRVVGMAFVGRMVADLDRSVAFYAALGFREDPGVGAIWRSERTTAQLYGVGSIHTRTAQMFVINEASGQRFTLLLQEAKGIRRATHSGHPAWEPGATHFSLVVADAQMLWERLQATGMLHARSWGARLIAPPGQTQGSIAYLTDPDGLDIELLNQRPGPASGTDPGANPDTRPGVGHAGLVVRDSTKARAFYGELLGAHPSTAEAPWLKGDFYDSVVGGHGNIMRVYDESFAQASAPANRLNFALIEFQNRKQALAPYAITDIGVGYVGFEVAGLNALLSRVKAAGAKVISRGVIALGDGTREVMVRDPDVGGFLELFEPPRK